MRPEHIPELENYQHVREFVQLHLAMQFADVRALLRLPLRARGIGIEIEEGCNFTAASSLCNLISGISVTLFNRRGWQPDRRPGHPPRDSGQRFLGLLDGNYYPWRNDESRRQKRHLLYQMVRNPMSHSLGVLEPGQARILIAKPPNGLSPNEINGLDAAYDNGEFLPPALSIENGEWVLRVHFLYAAVAFMLRRLIADGGQTSRAEECFARGEMQD